jgi:hypothetical protein
MWGIRPFDYRYEYRAACEKLEEWYKRELLYATSYESEQRLREEYHYRVRKLETYYDYQVQEDTYRRITNAQLDILKFSMNPPIIYQSKETKVPTEPKKYIVINTKILDEDDVDYESSTFDTLAEAEKFAKEEARENKGESFTVFTTTKTFKVTEPVEEIAHV